MNDDKDPLRPRPTQDKRGFYMLPQAPMDSGYYVYGKLYGQPAKGAYQYAHPIMMTAVLRVAREWMMIDGRRFGVGDISMADAMRTPNHRGHRTGLNLDVRPLRKDGREEPVTWQQTGLYDQDGTRRLIHLFRTFAPVVTVIFNDPGIPYCSKAGNHDNHFHLDLRG
jgi:murein endopeptidase